MFQGTKITKLFDQADCNEGNNNAALMKHLRQTMNKPDYVHFCTISELISLKIDDDDFIDEDLKTVFKNFQ